MARRTTKTTAAKAAAPVVTEPVVEITNETMVECRNGTAGNLIYKSTLNPGYTVEWEAFGDVQEMEYRELVSMRGNQRRFFEENWILIDDPAIIKKLGVERYYKNSLTTDNFNDVFTMPADEIKKIVPTLPGGTRMRLHLRLRKRSKPVSWTAAVRLRRWRTPCLLSWKTQFDVKEAGHGNHF